MNKMIFPSLEDLVPHRPPMILLDRMVSFGGTSGACEVDVRPDSPFTGAGGVPTYVGIEYMAQAVAAYSGFQRRSEGKSIEAGFLMGAPKFKSYCQSFGFGQTLRVEVKQIWGGSQLARFACVIKNAGTGELLQDGELSFFKPENQNDILKAFVP